MKLKNLQISNFRCFKSLSIDLDEHLTVLVAENGVGKTAILDAIAIALGPFMGGFDTGISKGFKHEDARLAIRGGLHLKLEDANQRMEAQYPITLVASGVIDGQLEQWSRELTGKKTQTTFGKARVIIDYAKKLQQQVRAGEQVSLPIVAYYGTGRLWKQIKASNKHPTESHSRLYGYHDALNPKSTYEAFEKWFTDISLAEYSDRFAKLKDNIAKINVSYMKILANQDAYEFLDATSNRSTELEHVRKAIDQCLFASGWNTLEYDFKWRELVVRSNDSNLSNFMPVARLSDGVKAMLSLTADIAYRCVQLNPHLVSPTKETNGIVLIDEVDLHLHPKWQQTVLNDLQKAFSSIQFIVTTHSPQVVSTVPSHQIRILDGNQVYSAEAGTKGAESSRILKRIFGTEIRPQNDPNTILLNEYLNLVYADKWNDEEAQKKRKELDDIYQGNEPELTKADLYIENRIWELEIEENQ